MTRNDYKIIAEAFRQASTKDEVLENICVLLRQENVRFNEEKFREAITKSGGK